MSDTTRTEYDRLIDEYMSGNLSPADQQAFDQKLAGDPALRRLFDAELEITRSVRRDAADVPIVKPVMSAHLLARIAETAPGSPGRNSVSATGRGGFFAWRGLITIVALVGVGVAGFFLLPDISRRQPAPAAQSKVSSPSPVVPPAQQRDNSTPRSGQAADGEQPLMAPAPAVVVPERAAKSAPPQTQRPKAEPRDDERALREYMEAQEKSAAAPVEENDEVRTTIGSK